MTSKALSKELSPIGVAQIMLGLIQLTFGIPWYFITRDVYGSDSATPFWTGIWYVISGSLTTEIKDLSNSFKVKVVLGANIISAFVAGVGIIAYSLSFYHRRGYNWEYRPVVPVAFVLLLQMFTAAELVLAVISAMLIARHLFRCCNLNSISEMGSMFEACSPSNVLRSDPRRLRNFGVVQIMVGLINLGFGVPLYYATSTVLAIDLWVPWWAGLLYVLSGSLTMLSVDSPESRLKQAAKVSNIISTVVAAVALLVFILSTFVTRSGHSAYVADLFSFPAYVTGNNVRVARVPLLLLVLLFLYSTVEFIFALIVSIILCKK